MRQGIRWGLIVRSILGRSKCRGGKEGVTKTTMLQPSVIPEGGVALKNVVCAIHTASINHWYDTLFYYSLRTFLPQVMLEVCRVRVAF